MTLTDQNGNELVVRTVEPKAGPLVVPVGGYLILHWSVNGQSALNVLGLFVQAGGVFNQALADAMATMVRGQAVASNIGAQISNTTSLIGVGVRDLRTANQPEYNGTMTAFPGTDTTERTGGQQALVVTLRTALAGKSFRGRVYLPLDGNTAFDGPTSQYTTLAANAGVAFIDGIRSSLPSLPGFSNIFGLAVISRKISQANTVISVSSRNRITGSQRRRLPPRR